VRAAASLLLALAAAVAPARAGAAEVKEKIQDARQDIKQVQQQLKQRQQALQKTVKQERSLLGELEQLNRELESARREAGTHVKNLGLVQDRLVQIRSRLDQLQAEEAQDRASLKRNLAELYKARSRRGPALLFGARSPAELSIRARYLNSLSRGTDRRIRSLQSRIAQVSGYQEDYAGRQAELQRRRGEVEAARRKVERERQRRQSLLRNVRNQKAQAAQAVKDLERSFGRLQGLLAQLQKEALRQAQARQAAGGRAAAPSAVGGAHTLRKGLAWPARGRLVARYGRQQHPVFKTPVFNRGIEIAAPHGSPVHAVAAGTVLHAAAMEGFGELVVLDHGGGMMSVYGYGSKVHVRPGQGVATGDLIAEVGEAGASNQPALYFEIRQGAKALDPFTYLRRQ
jgi:murein hydrolase activator